jgi:isocitrate dehydrogenase
MAKYLGEISISEAIFSATESVINENKYVTYDMGGSATLSRMAEEIATKAARLLRK